MIRGSMDLVHILMDPVHGPGPRRGSMDQGSMFCTFPMYNTTYKVFNTFKKYIFICSYDWGRHSGLIVSALDSGLCGMV